jgi:hypothetical protein
LLAGGNAAAAELGFGADGGAGEMGEDELASLVTRNGLIGTAVR